MLSNLYSSIPGTPYLIGVPEIAWERGQRIEVPSVFRLPGRAVHAINFFPYCLRIQCSMNWIGEV